MTLVAGAVLVAAGCGSEEPVAVPEATSGEVTAIDSSQGRELIESGDALVIDVRPRAVYIAGHLVGAQHIDVADSDLWVSRVEPLDRSRPTVVYGSSAEQSATATQMLVDEGFTAVYDLGGVSGWDPAELQLES